MAQNNPQSNLFSNIQVKSLQSSQPFIQGSGGGLFGAGTQGTGGASLFGGTTFGQQQTALGQSQNTATFGSQQQQQQNPAGQTSQPTGGLFGSAVASGNLFGAQTGTSTSGTTNLFGNTAQQNQPTGFGTQPTQGFGGSTNLFGQSTENKTGTTGFGQTSTTVGFGGLGGTSQTQEDKPKTENKGGLFGQGTGFGTSLVQSQPTLNLGGTQTTTQPTVSTGISGGLTGGTSGLSGTTGNLFGSNTNQQTSGILGNTQPSTQQTATQGTGSSIGQGFPLPKKQNNVGDTATTTQKDKKTQPTPGLFGQNQQTGTSNLFGQTATQKTSTDQQKSSETTNTTQQKPNLFGTTFGNAPQKTAEKEKTSQDKPQQSTSLFNPTQTTKAPLTQQNQQDKAASQQQQQPSLGLGQKKEEQKAATTGIGQGSGGSGGAGSSLFNPAGQKPPATNKQNEEQKEQQKPGVASTMNQQAEQKQQPHQLDQQKQDGQITQAQTMNVSQTNTAQNQLLHRLINKWYDQLRRNEEEFRYQCNQLSVYEKTIFDSIEHVKKIEQSSVQVKKIYEDNVRTLNVINNEQSSILTQLDSIDKELDILLNTGDNTYIDFFKGDIAKLKTGTTKDQIMKKAIEIQKDVDDMANTLQLVRTSIDQVQERNNTSRLQLMHGDHPVKIDETLNIYYETLLWLENAAIDLNFQVEQVADKLGHINQENI